jgi:hypothetical protein
METVAAQDKGFGGVDGVGEKLIFYMAILSCASIIGKRDIRKKAQWRRCVIKVCMSNLKQKRLNQINEFPNYMEVIDG